MSQSQPQPQSQLEREKLLAQEIINSTLNSSQIHDYGFAERKRYGKLNNASDIFNVKEIDKAAAFNNKRKYQNHHFQITSPFGRDDITVDNPHRVQNYYNESSIPSNAMTDSMMPQTEQTYEASSETTTIEGKRNRRGMEPSSVASNGIERNEDIFVSREDLQTPEQRKEAILKRQKLDQLLNNDQAMNEPLSQQNQKFSAPFATSFDMKHNNNHHQGGNAMSSSLAHQNSNISVSGLAPFATIEYNPYAKYDSIHHSIPSSAQAKEFNQQVHPNLDPSILKEYKLAHANANANPQPQSQPVEPMDNHEHSMLMSSPSIIQTPYFHETSSRHLPREDDMMSNVGTSSSKGKEIDMGMDPTPSDPLPIPNSKPRESIDPESGAPLSKDHITSSFDKATALSHREESPEEVINKKKYEQAKNHFDELYRDIMATDDLKNHPELIEELNRISGTNYLNPNENLSSVTSPPLAPVPAKENSSIKAPPPSSQARYENNSANASKEDFYDSLEVLDKKLEKISFDSNQTTSSCPDPNSSNSKEPETSSTLPKTQAPPQAQEPERHNSRPDSISRQSQYSEGHHSTARLSRKNYNESHIFDKPLQTQDSKGSLKPSESFNNIFGTKETDPETEKKEKERNQSYNRRHLKLAQQNHSDIFCLGGDSTTHEQKLVASGVGQTQLPPDVPPLPTSSQRSSQMNLQTSSNNPMLTTYGSMSNSVSSMDRRQMAEQPAYGISSKQSHHTYKTKSRKFTDRKSVV